MKLSEFVKKRRENLGLKWSDISDAGIGAQTWHNITHDKQKSIKFGTMQKLVKLFQCSIGDIQECMAELPNPLRKEAEKPEGNAGIGITAKYKKKKTVMETVDKLEEIMKKEHPEEVEKIMKEKPYVTPEPDEEPAEVFQPEPETEKPYLPEYKSVYEEDRLEGEQRYRQKLKDMVLKIFVSGAPDIHTMEKIYADIGYALVKELVNDEA